LNSHQQISISPLKSHLLSGTSTVPVPSTSTDRYLILAPALLLVSVHFWSHTCNSELDLASLLAVAQPSTGDFNITTTVLDGLATGNSDVW
jgi:hypothetical protein